MRVLQLIDSLEAGGAERMAVNLANALVSEIDKSYLCATRAEGLLKEGIVPEVGYLFLKRTKTLDVFALKRLNGFVKKKHITVVHAHASSYFMATLLKLVKPKIAIIWHDHYGNSEFLDQRPKAILKFCSYFFKAIVAVNAQLATWDRNNLKCKAVKFLPNFVVPNKAIPETHLKGTAGHRILCLANLRPQKDHATLLNAFKIVYDLESTSTLHCVGKDFDDAYSSDLKELVKDLNLQNQVFFYGSCPDTDQIIAQSDIGVLSSKSEGLPLALLEYGLGGLAVIATNVGDCKLVIKNENLGHLVPSEDVEALSKALLHVLKDSQGCKDLGQALKGHVLQQFSQGAIIKQMMSIYV